MTVCAKIVATQSGDVLALDPSVTDLTTCAYVVDTGADYSGLRALSNLSIQDAQIIGSQIALLWAVAWGFKQIARAIWHTSTPERD